MPRVDSARADHRTFSAQLAGLKKVESLVRMGVMELLDGGADTGADEFSGSADGSAAAAGHALAHIRLDGGQSFELFSVEKVEIDSGTWDQTETEIYHLSRIKVL